MGSHTQSITFNIAILRSLMKENKITPKKITEDLNLPTGFIYKIFYDKSKQPKIEFFYRLSKYFERPIEDFLKVNKKGFDKAFENILN